MSLSEKVEFERLDISAVNFSSIKTFEGPGRGKKKCQDCGTYVGARVQHCQCGYDFDKKIGIKSIPIVEEKKEILPAELIAYINGIKVKKPVVVIYATADKCPFQLVEFDKESVYSFCHDVVDYGITLGKLYTTAVIKSYIRNQVQLEQQKEVLSTVDNWRKEICNEGS